MKKGQSRLAKGRINSKSRSGLEPDTLREQAERRLSERSAPTRLQDAQRVLHELEVHQIELEMQNEALRQTETASIASRERYADLYDFAPVGYFAFDHMGLITEVNLTGASLLGVERGQLKKKPFSLFVASPSRDTFHQHCSAVLRTDTAGTCELQLTRTDGTSFYALVQSVPVRDAEGNTIGVRSTIGDITERKGMEEALRKAHDELEKRVRERTEELLDSNSRLVTSEQALLGRLRFEQFLTDLSAGFIRVAPDRIESEIQDVLKRILHFFRVTHVVLVKAYPAENKAVITHAAHADDVPPGPPVGVDVAPLFPWASGLLQRGVVVRISTLDDLPPEAVADKEAYKKLGIRSILTIPVTLEDSSQYAISISSRREERVWHEEYIPRLQLMGEILLGTIERKRAMAQLEERLRFETLLADLSARFISLPVDLFDAEIEDVQRRICEWLDLDISTLWQLPADRPGSLLLTHFYAPKDFPPVPEVMDGKEAFPWCAEKLFQRENVILSRVTDAPAEAARDLEGWRHYGIKSVLTLPLSAGGGQVYGALSFSTIRDERDWPIEVVNRLQLVAEIFANALARRRAEEAIKKSETNYRRLHESMMDGFVLVSMDGMIREYNESYRQMTGYAPEELCKLTYRDLTPEKWHDFEQKIIEQQVLMKGYSEVYEKEYRKKDGTIFPVELRTFLLKDETGSNSGMWAIVRDITERKRAEDEAYEARRDMARMERLARMGELTASLSHELSQPLAAILTSAQAAVRFLQSDTPDLKVFRTILQNIIQDDKRAAGVITSLRSMMKREERVREPLSMNTVLDDVLNLFHSEAIVRNVTIERDFDVSLPPVLGDKNQLQQVVLNLIMNAAEAMSESLREHEKRKIILRTQATDHGIQVAVRDFGPGIDPAKLADIWQPFFTTKNAGLGMGLSVSRSIIQAHGGHISVENNPDRGATFYFDLPAAMNSDQ